MKRSTAVFATILSLVVATTLFAQSREAFESDDKSGQLESTSSDDAACEVDLKAVEKRIIEQTIAFAK